MATTQGITRGRRFFDEHMAYIYANKCSRVRRRESEHSRQLDTSTPLGPAANGLRNRARRYRPPTNRT
jgi:hypothetical protein